MDETSAAILASIVGAVFGGMVVHVTSLLRDTKTEARKLRVELLIRAYRTIVECDHHETITKRDGELLSQAMNDLMLLGTVREIEAVQSMVAQANLEETGTIRFGHVLDALREDLRAELGLPIYDIDDLSPTLFRFGPPKVSRKRSS